MIQVGRGLLDRTGAWMRELGLAGAAFVVADQAVAVHAERVVQVLRAAGYETRVSFVPSGEASKTLPRAEALYDWLLEHRVERQDTVVAVGGGVTGDLAGFVAATILRGVALVQVPTTLLAQIDSSIGGKVAVDHPRGKNLIGAFHQPRLVVTDTATLATLPRRELVAGWAEAIKIAYTFDPALLAELEERREALLAQDPEALPPVIRRCLELKLRVVEEDEREQGSRVLLNYGHTIAHGLEAALDYQGLRHGEAVSIGMVAAGTIAARLGLLAPEIAARQRDTLQRYGLPVHLPPVSLEAVLEAAQGDKKSRGRNLRWVLLRAIGEPVVTAEVPLSLVREVLADLQGESAR